MTGLRLWNWACSLGYSSLHGDVSEIGIIGLRQAKTGRENGIDFQTKKVYLKYIPNYDFN